MERASKSIIRRGPRLDMGLNDMVGTLEFGAKAGIAIVGSVFAYFFGGWSILITTLLILNVLDFVTGILASDDNVNSKRLTQGGTKKGLMWMWVLVANLLSMVVEYMGYPVGISIANAVLLYFILTEFVSLEENSQKLGSPMPTPITFLVQKLKDILEMKFNKKEVE